jgi:hypothetical protein
MSSDNALHEGSRLPQSRSASSTFRIITLLSLLATASHPHAQQPDSTRQTRTKHFLQQRQSTSSASALQSARAQSLALPALANLTTPWQLLGPSSIISPTFGNLTGRITALASDPNDTTGNTLYIGTTGGGVWKSTNAAGPLSTATFTPLTDSQSSLSIGALAVQPAINPVILAGTGDPNDATDSYYGEGLLRSTNGGATWTSIIGSHDGVNGNHSFAGLATAGIAFSTATPSLAVAAFSTSPQASIVSAANTTSIPGLYYSTDAGITWQMSSIYDGASAVQQPQPIGTGQVGIPATAVVWDALRQRFFAAIRSHGYYASTDGATWTRLSAQPGTTLTVANCPVGINGAGSSACPIFRGALAVQPTTGDLYALTVDANNNTLGLWQDLCLATANNCASAAPTFATRIDNNALSTNATTTIAQGSYNLTLAAAPAIGNTTILFAGTIDLYRCSIATNSSTCALRNTTNILNGCNAPAAVAPAQHALAAIAQSTGVPILYLGNDGGLWRSLDGVAETGVACAASDITHFDNMNAAIGTGGSLAEITSFAQDPTHPNTLLAGLGANGSAATTTASTLAAWPQLSAGEGGYPQLDPNTPANWMIAIGAGVNFAQCTLGSACTAANFIPPATIGASQVASDTSLLDAPTLLDPALTSDLIVATCRIWRGPAASGSTWSSSYAISPAFDGSKTPCTASSPLIRSIAAGGPSIISSNAQLSGSSVLYAGLAGALDGGGTRAGHLFVTTTANTAPAWRDIATSPVTNDATNTFNAAAFDISSVTADTHDPTGATVYATIMGFGYPHIYRSADFGAHWLNLSANLPDAPANGLVIDPNDANTVYIALDTGVYVTQSITACATTNCWSLLGTTLPNAPVIALAAAAGIPTSAGTLGMLRAATYGRGLWQIPLLTATSIAQPALTLSASNFTFTAQQVPTQSSAQTLTITSSGNAPVTISAFALTGDYIETDTCTGQTLTPPATCTVQIIFAPASIGARSGQLTVFANIPTGQAIVALSGIGTAPASIVFTPTSLTFAANTVNQSGASQIINIANLGGTVATLQTPVITGNTTDFVITANTCSTTLAANTACAIAITFTPTAAGSRAASLSLTDSAGTQTASLTGTGNASATDTLALSALTFAQQQLATTSAAQQITLTNSGGVALTLISASVSIGDFAIINSCGNSLAANSTCAITATFTPTATGTRTATLTLTDQFRSQTITLTGTGVAPPGVSLSPVALAFPATGVTLAAPPQTLVLTNNGGLPLTLAATISPGFSIASTTCGNTLAASAACTFIIVFNPTTTGPVSGALTLNTNAFPATQTTTLTGIGIDFALTPTGPTSATLSSGSTAIYTLQLSSPATLSGNIALACSGAPISSTCTLTPPTASLGNTTPITVTIVTGTTTASLVPTHPSYFYALLCIPFTLLLTRRKMRAPLRTFLLLLISTIAITGCASNRIIPPPVPITKPTVPTPNGTYNILITATAAGLTHTVPLTLTVQ